MKRASLFFINIIHIPSVCFSVIFAAMLLVPAKTKADCLHNFVRLEIAQVYTQQYPYLIAIYTSNKGTSSVLFKVDSVYVEGRDMLVSGPEVLRWEEGTYGGRIYSLPDSGKLYTDELCGNNHFGYYKPLRAAFPLFNLLNPTSMVHQSCFLSFPSPENIPNVEKHYSAWMEQLPDILKEYSMWWYQHASMGPPVLHHLIDSVLSSFEGGQKSAPSLYIDYNHCPGEGCRYGVWHTSKQITMYDSPNSSKKVGVIAAGESFTAIRGNVYLKPLEIIANEQFEVYDSEGSKLLEPGRKYYVLSNIGEGHASVWVNGRIMIASESIYNPSQTWWVEIKTKKGKKGWIQYPDDGTIQGSDYLE